VKTTIVILFLVNAAWVQLDGWGEREAKTEEECLVWVERVNEVLKTSTTLEYKVYCERVKSPSQTHIDVSTQTAVQSQ
jgi:hypothetical protein